VECKSCSIMHMRRSTSAPSLPILRRNVSAEALPALDSFANAASGSPPAYVPPPLAHVRSHAPVPLPVPRQRDRRGNDAPNRSKSQQSLQSSMMVGALYAPALTDLACHLDSRNGDDEADMSACLATPPEVDADVGEEETEQVVGGGDRSCTGRRGQPRRRQTKRFPSMTS